ncbi:acyl-CoA dehydrogenase [Amycolatopsis balhimycina DSM 5908]|uniref:Acyl-CoA dehydrogenase n=1 Tax=Amycolatopsis balhimycina DSM 5908 TaxID=1081091 RepID=A0A428WVQ3_AMYBA|nr:acyl-CoA dehydrogenase family protein [Amycolatopsis balhimycina]RSM47080.1 acyl-CoA dehydrogenase [Amycolatopsis balhimycina DSM 5908]
MRFALDKEQGELQSVVREFLADFSPEPVVRRLMAADELHDRPMWTKMCGELGLAGLAVPEEYGGAGYTFVELGVVLEELGRALAVTPFLASVVMATTLLLATGDEAAKRDYLPGLADGRLIGTVALAEDGGKWTSESVGMRAAHTGEGWVLDGHKSFVLDLLSADLVLVVARAEAGLGVFAVEPGAAGLDRQPLPVLDQTRKQGRLTCIATSARLIGTLDDGWAAVDRMLDLTAIAVSAEMLGGAQRTLDMAVAYAGVREQFGRPIGSFQAIKHKCATMLVEIEAARSAVYYALWAAATDAPDLAATASLTKAFCSDAYLLTAGENIQIHGGIGYTWEHPAHLYFKRAKNSALFLGGPDFHREQLAQRIGIQADNEVRRNP